MTLITRNFGLLLAFLMMSSLALGETDLTSLSLADTREFMQRNAKQDNIVVTDSGLQYEVLQEAEGASPLAESIVVVHYEGRLTSGQVFDSSIERGTPEEFELQRLIAGWTEGLQYMQIGSRFRFYIPPELGYGAEGKSGVIPPNAVLIFDVELLGIK